MHVEIHQKLNISPAGCVVPASTGLKATHRCRISPALHIMLSSSTSGLLLHSYARTLLTTSTHFFFRRYWSLYSSSLERTQSMFFLILPLHVLELNQTSNTPSFYTSFLFFLTCFPLSFLFLCSPFIPSFCPFLSIPVVFATFQILVCFHRSFLNSNSNM